MKIFIQLYDGIERYEASKAVLNDKYYKESFASLIKRFFDKIEYKNGIIKRKDDEFFITKFLLRL